MIVIISCGKKKKDVMSPAYALYQGTYFKLNLAYAEKLTKDLKQIYILSAKYGLVSAFQKIEPYNLKMGEKGCIISIKNQVKELELEDEKDVIVLGGSLYVNICKEVWPNCETPLRGKGGIGKQLRYLKTVLET